ncbi:YXWGXW repeat-containing protein [Burkholderia pseudomallei]|uniref:YXWGXW repeat-containing protein n=1 Tax=Burkholderia pseudomallei TaxID=28450 RepID=UPI001EE1FBD2|nr:YXWGXW repeat-containing protein [Burkholderia pseudomallei]
MTTVTGFVTIAGTRRVSVEPGRAIGSRRFQLTALEHHESTPFSSQAVVRRRLARRPGLRPRLCDAAAARAAVLTAPIVRRTTARRRSPVPRGRRIRAAPSGRLRRFGASAAPHHRARGYVWTNGYWRWPGGRSVWIPGRWIAQRPGHRWIPGCWRQRADVRLYIDGRWNCVRGEPHAVCRESRETHRGTRGGGASPPTNTAHPFSAQRFVERPCAPARAGDEPATRQTRGHAGGGPRIPPDGAD